MEGLKFLSGSKQANSLALGARGEHFRIPPKRTFDLKSEFLDFFLKKFCMILFNTRLQLAEEKKRHFLEQVTGNE